MSFIKLILIYVALALIFMVLCTFIPPILIGLVITAFFVFTVLEDKR